MILKRYKDFIVESKEDDLLICKGNFTVGKTMVENGKLIKDKIPYIIEGFFNIRSLELTTLEGCPKKVGGDFYCYDNNLTTLEGAPIKIGGNFICSYNNLTSLKGLFSKVEGYFDCGNNKLTSLESFPKELELNIYSDLKVEDSFIKSGSYIDNYWEDLLKYMIKEKIDLTELKNWPNYILDRYPILKSAKGISKFNL